jgi:cytochrome c oxidase subunit 5a
MLLRRLIPLRKPLPLSALPRPYSAAPAKAGEHQEGTGWNDYGTVEAYESKWIAFFTSPGLDQFELVRGLNKSFHFDIIPTIPVLEAALRAARRLDDFATASRVFGALREKCKNTKEYNQYVRYLNPIKQELGISSPEEFGRI